jgi:hypothetical protein
MEIPLNYIDLHHKTSQLKFQPITMASTCYEHETNLKKGFPKDVNKPYQR